MTDYSKNFPMNRLSKEKSPYLRHAASQKIDWYPWSDRAFDKAREQDKPVFLSSGAIWCHWCHVMAKECFEDKEIAKLLNEHFISIKLDRDERPDIDRRYQNAVSAMGFGGGWPLSVFLTPDKKPFFGGTYFPPVDSPERPGFQKVLKSVADFYSSKRDFVAEYSQKLTDSLKQKSFTEGDIQEAAVQDAVIKILSQFDTTHGGFGSAPKFPMPGAVQLLMNRYCLQRMHSFGYAINKTLESMAKGGFHDQLGGGFHRYSVDEAWIVPHFEKMADDNAWLLRNYLDAYSVFGNEYFKEVARGIINFLTDILSDPEGGFYASQDADVTPEDEGGYFTWTETDFRNILNQEEYQVLTLHFLHDRGSMHHDKSKKVLFIATESGTIAKNLGINQKAVIDRINSGKKKLLKERNKRVSPFIDKTLYTSLNGLVITSFLKAFNVLKDSSLKEFAMKSLQRILQEHYVDNELFHTGNIRAVLDDYVYLIEALISAYEVTGDTHYINHAVNLMDLCIEKFWDKDEGGFFDTDTEVLGIRLKGIEDIPHPSANAVGILLLQKLYCITGEKKYDRFSEMSLKIFSPQTKDMGIHAGYYFCAMDAYFHMLKLTVQTTPAHALAETARSLSYPYVSYVYQADKGCIIPCLRDVCYEPVKSPEGFQDFFRKHLKSYPG
jgi:uncharacterized protein YyaL (SSP411 family)